MQINHRLDAVGKQIVEKSEALYNSKFIVESEGYFLFYNPRPQIENDHTHYFRIRAFRGIPYISNGVPMMEEINKRGIDILADLDTDIGVYSKDRHDFVSAVSEKTQYEAFIDGGRDYTRSNVVAGCGFNIIPFEIALDSLVPRVYNSSD